MRGYGETASIHNGVIRQVQKHHVDLIALYGGNLYIVIHLERHLVPVRRIGVHPLGGLPGH